MKVSSYISQLGNGLLYIHRFCYDGPGFPPPPQLLSSCDILCLVKNKPPCRYKVAFMRKAGGDLRCYFIMPFARAPVRCPPSMCWCHQGEYDLPQNRHQETIMWMSAAEGGFLSPLSACSPTDPPSPPSLSDMPVRADKDNIKRSIKMGENMVARGLLNTKLK